MNELQRQIAIKPVPLGVFIEALRRTTATLGEDALMNDETEEVIAQELYAIALGEPEEDVFQ